MKRDMAVVEQKSWEKNSEYNWYKIVFASMLSMLIIGLIRTVKEDVWGVMFYGIVEL